VNFETLRVRQEGAVLFVDISAPPMNLLGTELVRDLVLLIQHIETDDACHVLVFTSADPDYFISHVDVTRISEYRDQAAKLTGEPSIAILFRYLSTSRLVTIAQIGVASAARVASSCWDAICALPRESRRSSASRNKGSA
jgi:enoyl-CoA hydratase/carnithine racemase